MKAGVSELKIDYGPGYRVYYTQRGGILIILLCGGDKRTQQADIRNAESLATGVIMAKIKIKTKLWNVQDYLKTEEDCRLFLEAAFDDAGDDPAYLAHAIGEVARARGMTRVARKTGLAREALYRSLSSDGNPELGTVLKVLYALGLQLTTKKRAA